MKNSKLGSGSDMKRKVIATMLIMLLVVGNLFASTSDDLGISGFVENVTNIISGAAIAIAVLTVVILGVGLMLKHSFDDRTKMAFACVVAGGVVIALASKLVDAVFGSNMGAIL